MKVAYFDCFSGASGDMILGALLDAGFQIKFLERELAKLKLSAPFKLRKEKVSRGDLRGTKFSVKFSPTTPRPRKPTPTSFKEIEKLIKRSALKPRIKELSTEIFRCLARAEGRVHQRKLEDVQFHEVGSLDSIIDIVGVAIVVEELGIQRFYSSRPRVGSGFVESHSGRLPVPAPATLELLKGQEIVISRVPHELTTPTGAAILITLCDSFGRVPAFKVARVGYGAGSRELVQAPNLLRVVVGEMSRDFAEDSIVVIQTNIDDLAPVSYERLFERLFGEGALDVYITPIQMKKSRPGVLLTVLCEKFLQPTMASIIFDETTTFGMRHYEVDRYKLERSTQTVNTKYGPIRVKVGTAAGGLKTVSPEYEDCKRVAERLKLPLHKVYGEVKVVYRTEFNS